MQGIKLGGAGLVERFLTGSSHSSPTVLSITRQRSSKTMELAVRFAVFDRTHVQTTAEHLVRH